MKRMDLKNKPLVEAIFELRWELQRVPPGVVKVDPEYKLLIGRLYDKLQKDYPFHEQLPAATMPDEIAGYVVQHRFRKEKDKWPLIQIGPGIMTVNDTEGYTWGDFVKRINKAINTLFEVYPDSMSGFKVNRLLLRYIDAIPFDYEKNDILDFLRQLLKTEVNLYPKLFKDTGVEKLPLGFDLKFNFSSTKPKGTIYLRFGRGKKIGGPDALLWETMVQSASEELSIGKDRIVKWAEEAHELTKEWFFLLIEGLLLERFK